MWERRLSPSNRCSSKFPAAAPHLTAPITPNHQPWSQFLRHDQKHLGVQRRKSRKRRVCRLFPLSRRDQLQFGSISPASFPPPLPLNQPHVLCGILQQESVLSPSSSQLTFAFPSLLPSLLALSSTSMVATEQHPSVQHRGGPARSGCTSLHSLFCVKWLL